MRAGHARVGDRSGAAGLHAGVVCLYVRVRPDHGRGLAVEEAGQRDLLARRLRVDVDDDDRRASQCLLDELLGDLERADRRADEERPEQVDHGDVRSVRGGDECEAASRGA